MSGIDVFSFWLDLKHTASQQHKFSTSFFILVM